MVNYIATNLIHNISDIDCKADALLKLSVEDTNDIMNTFRCSQHEQNVLQVWLDDSKALIKDKRAWKDAVQRFKTRS